MKHNFVQSTAVERRARRQGLAKISLSSIKTREIEERFPSVESAVAALRPEHPLYAMHPQALEESARVFLRHFPGRVFYAVKANPDPYVLRKLFAAGIRQFDVASVGEIELVRTILPEADLAFMHTIKSREAIRSAYFDYGVRVFSLDCADELEKIRAATDGASDLFLFVRLGMPHGSAAHPLSDKFGASPDEAVSLLQDVARTAAQVGLSFHVGQQTLDPASFELAVQSAGAVLAQSGVRLAALDVGGGFPAAGLGDDVLPPAAYLKVIRAAVARLNLPASCELWCEPGRALCATATTLVLRVELRKGDKLYLNDGSYGALFDLCWVRSHNDVYRLRPDHGVSDSTTPLAPFEFYGPTCDSIDHMKGPFLLPADMREGDWIAFRNAGSYVRTMRTGFNGFDTDMKVEVGALEESGKPRLKAVRSRKGGV